MPKLKTGTPAPLPEGKKVLIKAPGQKANFWKPKAVGELIVGKLMAITLGKYGATLRVAAPTGTVSIPVNVYLEDVDWNPYKGKVLSFEFKGLYGRGCRLYEVNEIQEDVPF